MRSVSRAIQLIELDRRTACVRQLEPSRGRLPPRCSRKRCAVASAIGQALLAARRPTGDDLSSNTARRHRSLSTISAANPTSTTAGPRSHRRQQRAVAPHAANGAVLQSEPMSKTDGYRAHVPGRELSEAILDAVHTRMRELGLFGCT